MEMLTSWCCCEKSHEPNKTFGSTFWSHQYPQRILWKSRHQYLRHLMMDRSRKTQRLDLKEALDKTSWGSLKLLKILLWEPWITVPNLMTMCKQHQVILVWTICIWMDRRQNISMLKPHCLRAKGQLWLGPNLCVRATKYQETLKYGKSSNSLLSEHSPSALNYPSHFFLQKPQQH